MTMSHNKVFAYTLALLVIGVLHHTDHVLRYDHSGWPFKPDITAFTFSLLVYPTILSLLLINSKAYRVSVSVAIAVVLLGAHTFLETPLDQFNTWARNHSDSPHALGQPNLLDIQSPALGALSVILSMLLNIGVLLLPFIYLREEKFDTK